ARHRHRSSQIRNALQDRQSKRLGTEHRSSRRAYRHERRLREPGSVCDTLSSDHRPVALELATRLIGGSAIISKRSASAANLSGRKWPIVISTGPLDGWLSNR